MQIRRPFFLLLIALGAALPAMAGAAHTRPGGGGGGGGGGARPPHHVQGNATWGHGGYYGHGGHGHGGGYPYYGYPYYGYPYSGWWGYPYWGWGVSFGWGWGAPYGAYGPAYVEQGGAENVPGQAWVETDVRPKRATVRLDGEDVGFAGDWNGVWNRLPIEPGNHELEFTLEGHRSLQVHVAAQSGRIYHISRELARGEGTDAEPSAPEPAPQANPAYPPPSQESAGGYLHLSVEPSDAAVYLDGTFVGRALELRKRSASRPLPAGEHELEVVRPGYLPERRTVTVEPDGVQELKIELRPEGPEGPRAFSSRGSGGFSPA